MQFDELTYVYTCEIITKIKMTLQVSLYSCVNSLPLVLLSLIHRKPLVCFLISTF